MVVDMIAQIGHETGEIVDMAAYCHIYGIHRCGTVISFGHIPDTIAHAQVPGQFFATYYGHYNIWVHTEATAIDRIDAVIYIAEGKANERIMAALLPFLFAVGL